MTNDDPHVRSQPPAGAAVHELPLSRGAITTDGCA